MTSLSTAADTQLSGLTGRKSKVNRNLAIVSQIPAMREIAASNSARKKQEKQDQQARTLSEEQAGIAKSQANKSAAVQGATTLGQAAYLTKDAWLPAAKGALGIGESVANPALSAAATEAVLSSAPISATQSAAPVAGVISTAVPESAAMVEAAPGLVEAATAPLNVAPEAVAAAGEAALTTAAPVTAGAASLSGAASAAMAAAPWAAAGYLAAKFGGGLLENIAGKGESNVVSQFARTVQKPFQGIGKPWVDEIFKNDEGTKKTIKTIMDVMNPIGWISEKICIIITVCTSPDSPEVNITREYRDTLMPPHQLRGYYMIAERLVPWIRKSDKNKQFAKKWLVDPLIEGVKYSLGYSPHRSLYARFVKFSFLGLCSLAGRTRKSFTRSNGEVF